MSALGFKAGRPDGERLYKLMKVCIVLSCSICLIRTNPYVRQEEAVHEYRKIIQDKRTRSPDFDHHDHANPRYAYTQIDKLTIHKAIESIYDRAGPETKAVYDRGRDPAVDAESNWIIRWMLYHCFRYRDGRNKRPPTASMTQEDKGSVSSVDEQPMSATFANHHNPNTFWLQPPRPPLGSTRGKNVDDDDEPGGDRPPPGRPLPYDPVRA